MLDSTLAENIAFGETLEEIDYEKLERSIEAAQLSNTISSFLNGIKTQIGEFGSNISGGQRQRIAIARALYRGAEVLIFDEATSSLDNETELELMNTIDKIKNKNITIISIAHKYNSLKTCDVIYEIKMQKSVDLSHMMKLKNNYFLS